MARIRTVKPEFWDSPGIETLNPMWRLLYIAMWNWADDTGRGKAEARELMGFAFPRDEDMSLGEFRRGLGEVRRVFGVNFYRVDGRSYYSIPSWEKHQKIDKRSGSRWPAPEDGEPYDPTEKPQVRASVGGHSEEPAEAPPSVRRESGAGTGEQGNRGTGEVTTLFNAADAPIERDHTTTEPTTDYPADFEDFWNTYPRRQKKRDALKAFTNAKKRATLPAIIAGAEQLRDDPNRVDQYTPLAASWLNANGWEDEPLPPRHNNHQPSRAQQRWNNNAAVVARFQEREQARGEIAQ